MSFIETEASYRIEVINGKPVKIITPQTEITLTNTRTGQEYNSDAEAMKASFFKPKENSKEVKYLKEQRKKLGG